MGDAVVLKFLGSPAL